MVGLGQTVADAMTKTGAIEGMSTPSCRKPSTILRQIGELDSVVGEHSVDAIGNGCDECFEEGSGRLHIGLFNEFDHSELRGPVDGHEEVELALGRSHFRQIDMEEADRIAVELLPPGLVAFHLGQPVDAMPPRQRPQTLLTMLYRSTDRLCRCGAPVQYLSHSASFHSLEKYAASNAGTKHLDQPEPCPG